MDERKNEVNGSNNEINQSDILLILFSQGLKNLTHADRGEGGGGGVKNSLKNADVINERPLTDVEQYCSEEH